MRTTVTVDDDVEELLRQAMQQTGQSFKTTLNQAIRKGLATVAPGEPEPPFVIMSQSMGLRAGIDPAQLQHVGDELEVDAFLNLTRRLQEASSDARPRAS
jgi:hypothetical protein